MQFRTANLETERDVQFRPFVTRADTRSQTNAESKIDLSQQFHCSLFLNSCFFFFLFFFDIFSVTSPFSFINSVYNRILSTLGIIAPFVKFFHRIRRPLFRNRSFFTRFLINARPTKLPIEKRTRYVMRCI